MNASIVAVDDRYSSGDVLARAIGALQPADFAKLGRIGQLRARGLPEVDWQDLVQEAVRRCLDGSRRWPVHVPLLTFMTEVIRSIAHDHWRRRLREAAVSLSDQDGEGAPTLAELSSSAPSPEAIAQDRQLVALVGRLFAQDPAALAILSGLAQGLDPAEIQEQAGLTPTDYDSTRRRMRRTIARSNLLETDNA